MMTPVVTAFYAALSAVFLIYLSARVIRRRYVARVSVGDGADRILQRAMRLQANFVEYVPLTLLLMALAEMQAAPVALVHAVGALMLVGRILHRIGFGREPDLFAARKWGMILTFVALGAAAALNGALALPAMLAF